MRHVPHEVTVFFGKTQVIYDASFESQRMGISEKRSDPAGTSALYFSWVAELSH